MTEKEFLVFMAEELGAINRILSRGLVGENEDQKLGFLMGIRTAAHDQLIYLADDITDRIEKIDF